MGEAAQCVAADVLRALAADIFRAAGSEAHEATLVGDHLVDANLAGHDSHGVIRVSKYLDWHARGMVLANRHATVVREIAVARRRRRGFGYGQVIGREAMDLAIAKARHAGHARSRSATPATGPHRRMGRARGGEPASPLSISSTRRASAFWSRRTAAATGAFPRTRSPPARRGAGGAPLVLDMSTSAIAEGKIQVAPNRGEMLPPGCTIDSEGRPNRDPAVFYGPPPGALLPFGGHKGYGLSVFCEIFAGALTGGQTTHPGQSPRRAGSSTTCFRSCSTPKHFAVPKSSTTRSIGSSTGSRPRRRSRPKR